MGHLSRAGAPRTLPRDPIVRRVVRRRFVSDRRGDASRAWGPARSARAETRDATRVSTGRRERSSPPRSSRRHRARLRNSHRAFHLELNHQPIASPLDGAPRRRSTWRPRSPAPARAWRRPWRIARRSPTSRPGNSPPPSPLALLDRRVATSPRRSRHPSTRARPRAHTAVPSAPSRPRRAATADSLRPPRPPPSPPTSTSTSCTAARGSSRSARSSV